MDKDIVADYGNLYRAYKEAKQHLIRTSILIYMNTFTSARRC